jgi:hypothetical protein
VVNGHLHKIFSRSMKGGTRGKYTEQYRKGTNVVLLDPDVAEAFPTGACSRRSLAQHAHHNSRYAEPRRTEASQAAQVRLYNH